MSKQSRQILINKFSPHLSDIQNPQCSIKNTKIFLVHATWFKDFEKYMDPSLNPRVPGKMKIKCLIKTEKDGKSIYNPQLVYEKDYKIITKNLWELFNENFGADAEPIFVSYILNPVTSEPTIILNPIVFNVQLEDRKITKNAHPDWMIKDVKTQLCQALSYDPSEYSFYAAFNQRVDEDITCERAASIHGNSISLFDNSHHGPDPNATAKLSTAQEEKPKIKIYSEKKTINIRSNIQPPEKHNYVNTKVNTNIYRNVFLKSSIQKSTNFDQISPATDEGKDFSKSKINTIGLYNLGNTCYFNAALQCLIRIKSLTQFVLSDKFSNSLNLDNTKG